MSRTTAGSDAAGRAREVARRIGRPDLELITLDALTSGMNIRGLYGQAEPFERERLAIARTVRDPFEVGDSFYTAAWSALEVGLYADVVALLVEYEAFPQHLLPVGHLSLAILAQVPLGDWDDALAGQARLRELLGGTTAPPSFASGAYGAEVLLHEARGDRAAADAVLAEIDAWSAAGERPRLWPVAPAVVALARRGDFAAAHRRLDGLHDLGIYLARELEVRCTLIAEERAWDDADPVIARARRYAELGRLRALPLHADRLEGRARLAAGDAAGAVASLERAATGFARLDAAWEVALTELSLGEALAAVGRSEDAGAILIRAAETFERLRVPRELERARALLVTA
jgi:ATP/maltotriose-dependent transcriptional regulator MalT